MDEEEATGVFASKAKDLNFKGLRKALEKINEALEYFCKNDLLYLYESQM